ncbi:hypothetical protein SAMN05421788_112222 [Filimonas lacunae]|uniref:CAAX prenyl protease 2/Lysostaphin resistance protein A-like domain-containing protein n=1 Tax=Filimonas lacunae TaxID=477680 RepID=A0A173MLC4_9BACT|nr:type II CAAX endopeptidase family protein [Filimonas lacunae]BAV08414.1 metal-dependent membrane protease [Filimonas lacunae]SIT33538.1 hypothetical protein SAMN05421788_112222 [Filimonas lacunae]
MNKKPLIKHGWLRVVVFVILIATPGLLVFLPATQQYIPFRELYDTTGMKFPMLYLSYLVTNGFMLIPAYLFCRFVDRRSFSSLGFEWGEYEADAWTGFFAGINLLSTGTLILLITGTLSLSIVLPNFLQLLYAIIFFAIVAFVEEIVGRGYILRNLMQSLPPMYALVISALIFSLLHLPNPTIGILPLVNLFALGLLLGINFIYTQNLWFGIFLHFSWNLVQGPLLGYSVSGISVNSVLQQSLDGSDIITGGSFGFEGSVVALATVIGVTFWVGDMYRGNSTKLQRIK